MRKLTTEEWVKRAKQVHGDRYDYSDTIYVTSRDMVNIRCHIHGVFAQRPFDHIRGHGCSKCGFELPRNEDWKGRRPEKKVEGVGINDMPFTKSGGAYLIWHNLLKRCYNTKIQERQPMYVGCSVCNEWLTFSNFKRWFENPENGYREGYQLDKDIIIKGNKTYSPETCCFVPQAINCLFGYNSNKASKLPTGVFYHHGRIEAIINQHGHNVKLGEFPTPDEAFAAYKQAKEAYIKDIATEYYQRGDITQRVYEALMRYEVGIKG